MQEERVKIKYHYNVEADLVDEKLALSKNSKLEEVVKKENFNPIGDLNIPSKKMRLKPIIVGLGPSRYFCCSCFRGSWYRSHCYRTW